MCGKKTALPVRQSVLTTSFICECRYYCCMQLVSMTRKWYPLICSLWALPFSAMPRCVRHRPQCNVPLRNFHSHTHTNMPALCCSRRYCTTPKNCLSLCEWAILCALSRICALSMPRHHHTLPPYTTIRICYAMLFTIPKIQNLLLRVVYCNLPQGLVYLAQYQLLYFLVTSMPK